jgi:Protein of unknown function (DUF1501)
MKPNLTCGSIDHNLHRRLFLQGVAAGSAASLFSFEGLLTNKAIADEAKKQQKHCIVVWLCGAPSQFETWDPKPKRITGGPFRSIPTNVTGLQISELMPKCATIMDKLTVIRSMKTEPSEHFQAIDMMTRGEKPRLPFTRPTLGSVVGQQLALADSPIPSFVLLDPSPEGNEFKSFKAGDWSGWLGAENAPVRAGGKFTIPNIDRLAEMNAIDHADREAFRSFLSRHYEQVQKSDSANSLNAAFDRVKELMSCAPLFDMASLPEADQQKYGPGAFGMHCLQARHLVENGAPFVMVANGMPWDCHVLNHEIHQMLVPEMDRVVFHLINDLSERGMLENTLVVVMGEFGRTPWLNEARGRDHYPMAWSMAMAGCGIRGGTVYGATDEDGVEVIENAVDQRRLFATIFSALGIDPHAVYDLPDFPTFHRVEGNTEPIREILL